MSNDSTRNNNTDKDYTADFSDVLAKEQEYIKKRRAKVLGDKEKNSDELYGIAFSGGGIRSATFSLGVIQGLIKSGMFKFFDYMSTVSGGGYIGSCLSSLLAHDNEAGVNEEDSPFSGLRSDNLHYTDASSTTLNVRNQLHHLREHARYLAVDGKVVSRDIQRMIGTFSFGSLYHFFLFTLVMLVMVAGIHLILLPFSMTDSNKEWAMMKKSLATANAYLAFPEDEASIPDSTNGSTNDSTIYTNSVEKIVTSLVDSSFTSNDIDTIRAIVKNEDHLSVDERIDSADYYTEQWADYNIQWQSSIKSYPDLTKLGFDYSDARSSSSLTLSWEGIWLKVEGWYEECITPPLQELYGGKSFLPNISLLFCGYYLWSFICGILFSLILFGVIFSVRKKMTYWLFNLSMKSDADKQWFNTWVRSGETPSDTVERRFLHLFNSLSFSLSIIGTWIYRQYWNHDMGLEGLNIPLAFSIGAYGVVVLCSLVWETKNRRSKKTTVLDSESNPHAIPSRITRSLLASVKGGGLYGVLAALIIPPLIIVMLSVSYFDYNFFLSVILLAAGSYLFSKGDAKLAIPQTLLQKFYKPLLNGVVLLFLLTAISPATWVLIKLYEQVNKLLDVRPTEFYLLILIAIGLGIGILCLITMRVNANRLSAHYFYRDRLAEAYLMTNSRVERVHTDNQQGMPRVTVRNNDEMRLQEIGANDNAPYHLIVTALNLRGSDEILRKTMKSDHFIMTRDWVGSHTTGYVRTEKYHEGGNLRLATAMTISAAAFTSIVGFRTFFAQSLMATLFNLRLGYWIENPWFYKSTPESEEKAKDGKPAPLAKEPNSKTVVWIWYLMRELLGSTTARTPFVNLSDGGHTGDNLGLLPLLQRRCKVIVVVDAEADSHYEFESFNNAARMALVEENINIDIDLTPIVRKSEERSEFDLQEQSLAIGVIHYPEIHAKPETSAQDTEKNTSGKAQKKKGEEKGILIYIKASCSDYSNESIGQIMKKIDLMDEREEEFTKKTHSKKKEKYSAILRRMVSLTEKPSEVELPPHVANYNRSNKDFPHQSTLNQFYDTAQFEAYRALGKYIARQLTTAICSKELITETPTEGKKNP